MTVGELKRRMTTEELRGWELYAQEMGPLNVALRVEGAVARAVKPFLKNATMRQLMIWPKEPEREATLEDFMSILKAAKKPETPHG